MFCPICEESFHKKIIKPSTNGYYYLVCPHCSGGILMPRNKALKKLKQAYQPAYFNWQEAVGFRKFLNKLQFFTPYTLWINKIYQQKPGKLLDVGAGIPDFIIKINKYGWIGYALEIAPQQVNLLKKYIGTNKVMQGDFENFPLKPNKFNILTFWHMLEHLTFPAQSIRKVHQVLKKQGMIFAEFPNFDSFNLSLFGSEYIHFDLPGHLVYYNKKSIVKLLQKNGFSNIKISYPLKLNGSTSLNLSRIVYKKTNSQILSQSLFYILLPLSFMLSVMNAFLGRTDLIRISATRN